MADFSNFELTPELDVTQLADGVLSEMGEVFGVDVSDESADSIGQLVGAIGTSKVLQENIGQVQEVLGTDADALGIAADWVERSGIQKPLDRSLWTPDRSAPLEAVTVITGAVANWQDRVANLLVEREPSEVYIPVGNRIMDSATEKTNPNVMAFEEAEGESPTEEQYARTVIRPRLELAGHDVTIYGYKIANGEAIAERFFEDETMLFSSGYVSFGRVANAGIQLAGQFVRAARQSGFDTDPMSPQAFVLTDTFPIARTEDETRNPREFQNPLTAIRQIAITAKELAQIKP